VKYDNEEYLGGSCLAIIATYFAQQKLETVGAKQCGFCNHLLCPLWEQSCGKSWCPLTILLLFFQLVPRYTRQNEWPCRGLHQHTNSFFYLLDLIKQIWEMLGNVGPVFLFLGLVTWKFGHFGYYRSSLRLFQIWLQNFTQTSVYSSSTIIVRKCP
jgi:hypothetical protein